MILVNEPETPAVNDCHCVVPASAVEELELLISTDSPVFSVETLSVPKKVLFPAKDCVPVVTTPPLLAFAGAKFNTPEVMLAPFTFEVLVIVPTEIELPPPVLAMVIEPLPFVIEIPEPAVSVDLDNPFTSELPIRI